MRLRAASRGFTLIEVLVVVFIIGVILGFASLSLGGRSLEDRLDQEARRLLQVFQLAGDEAILTTTSIGFRPQANGYQFLVPGEEAWVPIDRPRSPFREHIFDIPATLTLTESPGAARDAANKGVPLLLFLSSGEVTPFELEMAVEGSPRVFRLRGRIDGLITLEAGVREP